MLKKILIFLSFTFLLYSNEIKLHFKNNNISNAQTALLTLEAKDINNVKLTLFTKEKINLNFYKNPFIRNQYYALIPISYYEEKGKKKVIVSYIKDNNKYFKSIYLNTKNGKFKKETINVPKKKFKPSKQRKKRTKEEYIEAIKVYKKKSSQILWKEEFILPMNSKITSNFGTKRLYNGSLKSYHSGTDFRSKIGEKVYASNSGIVRISKKRFYSGNSIVIDHGQGVYSCYFHLSKMNFKEGDSIRKGEVLGLSGNTGRVTGPHLHYSFRIHGFLVDPLQATKILNKLKY